MIDIVLSAQFKKDLKLAQKRGRNIDLLTQIIDKLQRREKLPEKNRDHALTGDYTGFRECHIQPDWLLIYRIDCVERFLFLSRTGTHSDLFA